MTEKHTPLWLREFGADYAVPDRLTNDPTLVDLSWHNDIAPSFTTLGLNNNDPDYHAGVDVRLWIEHPDPAQRENPGTSRIWVTEDRVFLWEAWDDSPEALEAAIAVLQREAAKFTQPASERRG